MILECRGRRLDLGERTQVMGVLNVTPDSFSDGGLFYDPEKAYARGMELEEEGADIIDIGGESTRPGADPVPEDEEIRRVLPVIERLTKSLRVPLSMDTYRSEVAKRALEAGAALVNDISGMRCDPEMPDIVARAGVPVVIMHMKGTPREMQKNPVYSCVIQEIMQFFRERIQWAVSRGIAKEKIILDPGIGFGKATGHNLEIMRRLKEFVSLGHPICIGPSRKSFIGHVLGLPVGERCEGTAAAVAMAVAHGARIIRVHDVKGMVRVCRMTEAICRGIEWVPA